MKWIGGGQLEAMFDNGEKQVARVAGKLRKAGASSRYRTGRAPRGAPQGKERRALQDVHPPAAAEVQPHVDHVESVFVEHKNAVDDAFFHNLDDLFAERARSDALKQENKELKYKCRDLGRKNRQLEGALAEEQAKSAVAHEEAAKLRRRVQELEKQVGRGPPEDESLLLAATCTD
eukprot:TRINITY_DN14995_c0_g1_i2.p1 TRINITY_DN14995_c0_g1~~TRINITY_DN14995_c0_g1_i2.p1  ORF type:complete len:176 (+),score=52.15 TRINITY_DN14995_c0_g1_i2:252-779(+)